MIIIGYVYAILKLIIAALIALSLSVLLIILTRWFWMQISSGRTPKRSQLQEEHPDEGPPVDVYLWHSNTWGEHEPRKHPGFLGWRKRIR